MTTHHRGLVAFVVIPGVLALTFAFSTGAASISASERDRRLHIEKDCTGYEGFAGQFCTIKMSNVGEIKVRSKIFYDQAAGIPSGLLDSNVVLDAGNGDRALGRCTLDFATMSGLCTFSDGTGVLTGFHARVEVSSLRDSHNGWAWDGTYGFDRESDRDKKDK
jgi:hypothetical protein